MVPNKQTNKQKVRRKKKTIYVSGTEEQVCQVCVVRADWGKPAVEEHSLAY